MFTTVFVSEIIVKKKKKEQRRKDKRSGYAITAQIIIIMSLPNPAPESIRMRVFAKKPARLVLSLAWLVEPAISYSGAFPWSGFS